MAEKMHACPACGRQIAASAKSCPQCGWHRGESFGASIVKIILIVVVVGGLILGAMLWQHKKAIDRESADMVRRMNSSSPFASKP